MEIDEDNMYNLSSDLVKDHNYIKNLIHFVTITL